MSEQPHPFGPRYGPPIDVWTEDDDRAVAAYANTTEAAFIRLRAAVGEAARIAHQAFLRGWLQAQERRRNREP